MRPLEHADNSEQRDGADGARPPQLNRGYLTDGQTLFHIERTLVEDPRGELLVELEDCATLELIVCSARSIPDLGMRPVRPLSSVAS